MADRNVSEAPFANRLCANCKQREGTVKWGESAVMVARGYSQMWCEVCALTKQIEHAEERAAALPELRCRLTVLSGDPAQERDVEYDVVYWSEHPHRFLTKPWEREGDPGYDGDPESCGLCHFTEGNPIHRGVRTLGRPGRAS